MCTLTSLVWIGVCNHRLVQIWSVVAVNSTGIGHFNKHVFPSDLRVIDMNLGI